MKPFEIAGNPHSNNNYSVYLGSVILHFSYKTLIGVHVFGPKYEGHTIDQSYRVKNAWGPTTGRHMKAVGLDMAQVVTEAELAEIVRGALFEDVVAAPLNHSDHTDMKEVA